MAVDGKLSEAPEEFLDVVSRLRAVQVRPELMLEEMPPPKRIAPFAFALSAEAVSHDEELATGRFVVLHDPSGPESWAGTYRIVSFVRAELEREVGGDPMLGQVGWSWLEDALTGHADFTAAGGTVTRVISESFGALSSRGSTTEIEVRASWTPLDDPALHLQAWAGLLSTVAGLPPVAPGVHSLPRRR
jgi:Protein of unknown function (DUF3000)